MGRNERKTSNFYPRPPRGGRLFRGIVRGGRWLISIHALREEGDSTVFRDSSTITKFLSTPSARRATLYLRKPLEGY